MGSEAWSIVACLIFSLTVLTLEILWRREQRRMRHELLVENRELTLLLASNSVQAYEQLKAVNEPPMPGYPAEAETYYTADDKQVELLKKVQGLNDDDIAALIGNDGLG